MKKIIRCLIIFIIPVTVLLLVNSNSKNNNKIEKILRSEYYSYLPQQAQEYVRNVYEKTGNIVLTEKNKKANKPYLNPQYVEYLTLDEEYQKEYGDIPVPTIVDYAIHENYEIKNVPQKYDLRNVNDKNFITPIRDQGKLGICWTFATAGVAESYLLKTNNVSYTNNAVLISERQLDYLTANNGITDYNSEYTSFIDRKLGDGGNFFISTVALANGVSLIDYNSFKEYDDTDYNRMELSDVISYHNSLYEANATINFPILNLRASTDNLSSSDIELRNYYLNEVKSDIMTYGAAYVGTFMNSSCKYIDSNSNNTIIDVYNCTMNSGHAMEIIGWDDDVQYTYCADGKRHNSDITNCQNIVSGQGVWILKNSWGNQLQYPYLTYDSLYTSISFITELEHSNNKNWDNNYILGTEEDITSKTYYLNDLNIKNSEKIRKIKFIAETADSTYNVKVYKDNKTYELFSKRSDLPGLITVDIDKDMIITKNSKIVIESDNEFIDKISIFTSNVDIEPYINLEPYDNISISENQIRLYSDTKNITSGENVIYKIYDFNNQDVSNNFIITNNVVAENNINTLVDISNEIDGGNYRIEALYNNNVISTINIKIIRMLGTGTQNDPYVITNASQLNQIRNDLDAYYVLGNDIDLSEDTKPGGKLSLKSETCSEGFGWEAINGFSGSLDGQGHTIKGLYQNNYLTCVKKGDEWYTWNRKGNGLFNKTEGNVTIKNLVFEDFYINCQADGDYCGILVSKYNANNNDFNDKTEYNATFENIVIRNGVVESTYNYLNTKSTYGGGIFGSIESIYGNVNINNIYVDYDFETQNIFDTSYLVSYLSSYDFDINNIQLSGVMNGQHSDGSGDILLAKDIFLRNENVTGTQISNILSMTDTKNVGSLIYWHRTFNIDGINSLNIGNKNLFYRDDLGSGMTEHINFYDKNTQIVEFTKRQNYNTWQNFDTYWNIKTIDGIPRIPVLKIVQDFKYTNIPDINFNHELNKHFTIYDYIEPNINVAKRVIYHSNNENIVQLDNNGTIIPISSGNTTIHVESLYDGYIKDVPIIINYVPHYTIYFDANTGEGEMDSIEVNALENFELPDNLFTKEYYEFSGWNTNPDGTGTSYSNLDELQGLSDKESITLYAQWIGEERIVTFDANGGEVTPESKVVRIGEKYGDLPIPIKNGYAFNGWIAYDVSHSNFMSIVPKRSVGYWGYDLVAQWIDNAYTIVYDANGGNVVADPLNSTSLKIMSNSLVVTYAKNSQNKNIADIIFQKTGYDFKEWNTKLDGSGTSYNPDDIIQLNNVDNSLLTLYAIWESNGGIITFNSNDGTSQIKIQEYTFNSDTKLEKNTFTRNNYLFKGWNTEPDGSGIQYTDEQIVNSSDNLVLYAQWEKIIPYKINNFDVDNDKKYIKGININTEVESFTPNIILGYGYGISVDTVNIDGKNVLYTGSKTRITHGLQSYVEYTNVVLGDTDGNGKINYLDYVKVYNHIQKDKHPDINKKLLENEYLLAADMSGDAKINYLDYVKIYNKIKELKGGIN